MPGRRRRPTIVDKACRGALAVALLAAGAPLAAQDTAPLAVASPDPAALVAQGRRVYTGLCARCHGINLVSTGLGADLRQFPPDAQERFRHSVSKGLRAMPAWETVLKPGDLEALWAYIGSVNGWKAPG